ncbi:MATE family efflux transporter [Dongia sp.]|uniref:MATE family efflux transporter n=1 Tax=Dongia sp. TaxID=1977262 RepID=UPI0035B0995D
MPVVRDILATLGLAAPIAVALLVEMAMGVSEYVMAGMLGTGALASGGFGAQFLYVPKILAMGALYSVAAMGSHAHGADKPDELLRILRQGLRLATFLSIPVMLIMLGLGPVLRLLAAHHSLDIPAIEQLMWWALPSVTPFLWFQVLRSFVTILGRPVAVTLIGLAILPVFIGLLYLLMFGFGGWSGMGVPAIGLATTLICWLQLGLGIFYIRRAHPFTAYPIFAHLLVGDAKLLKEMLIVGAPIAGAYLFESGMFFASTSAMSGFGDDTLAAHNIVLNITSITFMIPYALGQAGTVRVGYALGAERPHDARQAGFTAIGLGLSWMLCAAIVMWLAPRWLTGFYLDLDDASNATAIAVAMTLFPIAAIFQFFDGLQVSALGALRGYKDTRVPMAIAFVGYWVLGVGGGILLSYVLDVKGPGVWWGLAIGLAASGTMLLLRFLYLSRHRLVLD